MKSKMLTEHAQMHAGSVKGEKSENPKGEGKLGNGKMGGLKIKLII